MDVFSAFDPQLHYHATDKDLNAVDKRNNFPVLTYLMNHWSVGDQFRGRVGDAWCEGIVTWREMQTATWWITDYDGGYYGQRELDARDCVARGIAIDGFNRGRGYVPDCSDPEEITPPSCS